LISFDLGSGTGLNCMENFAVAAAAAAGRVNVPAQRVFSSYCAKVQYGGVVYEPISKTRDVTEGLQLRQPIYTHRKSPRVLS